MQENVEKFGLKNVLIVDSLAEENLAELPVPDFAFIVASPRLDAEISTLLKLNPEMGFLIYTLNFDILMSFPQIFRDNGLERTEAIHIQVGRVNSKNLVEPFPAPWLIAGRPQK